jgi:hypothetical protein
MDDEQLGLFLRELVGIEKRAIYGGSSTDAVRLKEVEKLVDRWFKELEHDEA